MDNIKKSFLKATSWRILGSVITFGTSYFLSGNFAIAGSVTTIEFISKIFLFVLHDRIWDKIKI